MNENLKEESKNHFTWASLCHFSALLGLIWWIPTGFDIWIPFGHLLAPFTVWLVKRKDSAFVDAAGKESLNFQIMMTIYGIILASVFVAIRGNIVLLLSIVDAVFVSIAGVKVSNGESYRYSLVLIRILR